MRRTCLSAILLLLAGCSERPVAELFEARQALAIARDYEADIYAPEEYEYARLDLRAAEDEIERQDQAVPWSRTYSRALALLEQTIEAAAVAQEVAGAVKEESFRLAEESIPQTQLAIVAAEEEVARAGRAAIPFTRLQTLRADLTIAVDYFRSAQQNFDDGDYVSAAAQVEAARRQAEMIREEATRLIALSDP